MHRIVAICWCLMVLSCLCGLVWAANGTFRPSPHFTGTTFPIPPQQIAAWAPPKVTLPESLITATAKLFQQGLADPRGCDYRVIEVGTGNCWTGDSGVTMTHGWVIPETMKGTQQYAVCWNGLLYPAVSVGEKANLTDDIAAIIQADEQKRLEYTKTHPTGTYHHGWDALPPENISISYTTLTPIKVCLLLRVGEGKLAQAYWSALGMPDMANSDPYQSFATDWIWALFDRAICAHMRGDDQLALLSAQALLPLKQAFETDAATGNTSHCSNFAFLKPLLKLLADEERRVKAPHTANLSVKALTAVPDQTKRIAGLIDALDEVSARQDGQPGGVTLTWDPIVAALIHEGDAAVEPLLTCLETDTRLTRSVSFGRDFHPDRHHIPVSSAAYVALAGILQTDAFAPESGEDAKTTAARIRTAWVKMKDITLEERWYRTLADDTATPEQWIAAINIIVQPINKFNVQGSGWVMTSVYTGETIPMRGESLRGKANPSVAELMAKRIRQLAAKREGTSNDKFFLAKVSNLALDLARWDLPTALPVLREIITACQDKQMTWYDSDGMLGTAIARMTLERIRGNDPQAIPEYIPWLRTVQPAKISNTNITGVFGPFWRFPDNPALSMAADTLFNTPDSAWNTIFSKDNAGLSTLLASPMLGVQGFRTRLLVALADTQPVGTVSIHPGSHRFDIKYTGGGGWTGETIDPGDPLIPSNDMEYPIRNCDLYCSYLSKVEGMPLFRLYWPVGARDQAVATCVALLRQYGDRYAFNRALPKEFYFKCPPDFSARMVFPRGMQPATQEDVEQRRAIFSLPPDVEKRLVPLPKFPLEAQWITLKKYPREQQSYDASKNESTSTIAYDQNVTVWQAEEMLVQGKWQRFFGVVEPHGVARVPAEEIEFTPQELWSWGRLSNGIDSQVSMLGTHRYMVGKPLTITLTLRNRRGLDQKVPSIFTMPLDDGRLSLRSGMVPHLCFSEDSASRFGGQDQQWQELPVQSAQGGAWGIDEKWNQLEPAASYSTTFDLNNLYRLIKPGFYRFSFSFANANPTYDFAEGKTNEAYFEIGNTESELSGR